MRSADLKLRFGETTLSEQLSYVLRIELEVEFEMAFSECTATINRAADWPNVSCVTWRIHFGGKQNKQTNPVG